MKKFKHVVIAFIVSNLLNFPLLSLFSVISDCPLVSLILKKAMAPHSSTLDYFICHSISWSFLFHFIQKAEGLNSIVMLPAVLGLICFLVCWETTSRGRCKEQYTGAYILIPALPLSYSWISLCLSVSFSLHMHLFLSLFVSLSPFQSLFINLSSLNLFN